MYNIIITYTSIHAIKNCTSWKKYKPHFSFYLQVVLFTIRKQQFFFSGQVTKYNQPTHFRIFFSFNSLNNTWLLLQKSCTTDCFFPAPFVIFYGTYKNLKFFIFLLWEKRENNSSFYLLRRIENHFNIDYLIFLQFRYRRNSPTIKHFKLDVYFNIYIETLYYFLKK